MSIDEDRIEVEEEVIENPETEESTEEETPVEEQEEVVDEDDEEDRVVTIGDEEPASEEEEETHQETPGWVKKVRKVNRNLERENKKLKKQLEAKEAPKEEEIELGPKPTLETSNFDDKKFEKNLIEWHDRSKVVEQQKIEKQKAVEEKNKAWQTKQERYANLKEDHGFKDFKDTEDAVTDVFNNTQQGILVDGAEDPALLVYALGKNPKVLEELSKITNPAEFTFKLAKVEAKLSVKNRKAPKPEKRVSGGKTGSGSVDKTLDRLRAEAERTGDYTPVRKYKQKLRGAK